MGFFKKGIKMQIQTNPSQKELKQHGEAEFPILVSKEQLSIYESGTFLWHWHPEVELTVIQSGEIIYHVNRSVYHLRQGDILFCNANALHSGSMFQKKDCSYLSVTFDPRLIYGFQESIVFRKYVDPIIQDMGFAAVLFSPENDGYVRLLTALQSLIRLFDRRPAYYEPDMICQLLQIWKIIFQCYSPKVPAADYEGKELIRIKQILSYLDQNFMNHITLEDISSVINLCPGECSRLFRRYMNVTLFSYLKEYRISRSLDFLAEPGLSVTEVAALSGFSDPNYYTKVFRSIKGCSPRTYRKKYFTCSPENTKCG